MKKRLLAILLALALVVSLMPVGVLAAPSEDEGQIFYDKDAAIEATGVTAKKTLESLGNNEYKITLSVEGGTSTSTTTTVLPADIVLVVDTSLSMNDAVTTGPCDGTSFTYSFGIFGIGSGWYCDKCGAYYGWSEPDHCTNTITASDRLDVAQAAAKQFASTLLEASDDIHIAVCDFSGQNYASHALTDNYNAIENTIDSFTTHETGTNYGAGLSKAADLLNGSNNRAKIVVFLSDGEPDGYAIDLYGTTAANSLKNNGTTIFSVGIDVDSGNALKDIASSDNEGNKYYYEASTDGSSGATLSAILRQITQEIPEVIHSGTNAVMTDVINTDAFEYVEDSASSNLNVSGDTLTWNIGTIGAQEQTASFTVKLKDGVYGEDLHTNDSVKLEFYSNGLEDNVTFETGAIGDPTVSAESPEPDLNGTAFKIQVFVDEEKVDNPYTYISEPKRVGSGGTGWKATLDDKGNITCDFDFETYDCADVEFTLKEPDKYFVQGISYGQTNGAGNPQSVSDKGNGNFVIDNMCKDPADHASIFIYTKYSVKYYLDEDELTDEYYTDDTTYIRGMRIQSTTDGKAFTDPNKKGSVIWRNPNCDNGTYKTGFGSMLELPEQAGYEVSGWTCNGTTGTIYNNDNVSRDEPLRIRNILPADGSTTIKFYATSEEIAKVNAGYFVLDPERFPDGFDPGTGYPTESYYPNATREEVTFNGDDEHEVDDTTGYIGYLTKEGEAYFNQHKDEEGRLVIDENFDKDWLILPEDFGQMQDKYGRDSIVPYQINNHTLGDNWPNVTEKDKNGHYPSSNAIHVDCYIKNVKVDVIYDANYKNGGQYIHEDGATTGKSYTVLGNDGSGEDQNFKRDGYTFTGWNTQANGKGDWYLSAEHGNNTTINPVTSGIVLYAQWEKDDTQTKTISYTVEYYKDGVKVDNDTQTVTKTVWVNDDSTTLEVKKDEINTTNMYEGYAFDYTDPSPIPETIENGEVIKVYYAKDENDDDIPDKYQVFVNFESADDAEGTVANAEGSEANNDATKVYTLMDGDEYATSGTITIANEGFTVTPADNYLFDYWTEGNDGDADAVDPFGEREVTGDTTITFYANFAEDSDGSGTPDKYEVAVTYEIEDAGSWDNPSGDNYVEKSNTFVYDNIALKVFDEDTQQWVNTDPTPTLGKDAPIPSGKDAAGNTDTGTWYEGETVADITNNTTITENVTYTLKFTAAPGLEVTKTAAETVNVGDTIDYTVTVENTGNVALRNVVVTDTMFGDKVTSITVDGTETDITADGYTIVTLPVGEIVTITYSYTATETDEDGVTNTVTAKAGEDGPEDTAKTETVVTNYTVSIAPADIVAYTGGKAYGAIVGEDGKESDVTASGLPRPGYHIELSADVVNWFTEHGVASTDPDEAAQDLSQYITFTYDDGNGTIREWTLTYRGIHDIDEITGEPTRYVYTLNATGNAPDVRLQYKDGDEYVFTDDFDMDENTVKAEYEMSIYPGDLNQNLIKAVIKVGEESIEATTKVGTGKLTVLSTTNVEYTNPITNPADGKISAAVPENTEVTFTVNDSEVTLNPIDVSLLVDSVSDSAEFNAQLEEHAANAVGMEGASTESFYLDLVHAENGNVQVGLNGTLTINWPMPSDANPEGDFKIVHYIAMDRNDTFAVDDLTGDDYHTNEVIENDDGTLSFNVGGFSPFVLVYEAKETAVTVDKSASEWRPEVGDRVKYTLVVQNTGNTTTDITVSDTLWKAGTVIILDDTAHTRVELDGNSHKFLDVPAGASITITYYYTPTWRDVGKLVNTATVTAGDATDTDTVTVRVDDGWTPNIPDDDDEDVEPDVEYTPNWLNTDDHFAYIVGYEDGSVRPTANITRAEVATIFFRLLTDEARAEFWSSENDFTDVASDAWYNNAVSTLSGMGILGGYEDGSFRPNASITRAEFVAIATRFFEYSARYEGGFTDVSYGDWYADCVQASADMGLVNGYEDGSFRPNASITRAEACAIVNRVLHRIPHEDHLLSESVMNVWPDNPKSAWYYADMQEATNSHDYDWTRESGSVVEDWTDKLPERDWSALETEWANAYSK